MSDASNDIAIIGMAAHLPGAPDAATFWDNLRAGRRAIRRLSEAELRAAGESAARMRAPNYVPYAAPLEGFAEFDADAFGFSPKEAAILDPQHRQFLEVAWEAFENAGHDPRRFAGLVGVYAGCGMGNYLYDNLLSNPDLVEDVGLFLLRHTGNDKDFLATRVSHILDLRGPAVNVQTACSTSLVALHYAAQALLTGECDMALAGGVTIELPHGRGYLYKENEILSPDGACHAFDHRAKGTVFGSGAGALVLRRLEDALAEGDRVIAVLKGSAINNDGAQKAGYLAPSIEGQAKAIAEAHAMAGVAPETISYVECHGTGTALGDPIEVAALAQAFGGVAPGSCRIGSVKTNIGHLDTAAGVASVIKVAHALQNRELPPSLGYEAPNPAIDFAATPFAVQDQLTRWRGPRPLRAGVNSLGVGGTNAHAVLEEAPERAPSEPSDWPFQLLTLSAKSAPALDASSARLSAHLAAAREVDLADMAYTLREGRAELGLRRVVVADSAQNAALMLADPKARVFTHRAMDAPDVVFMFPGGGAQYAGMARDLYETEPVFAEWMDRGLADLAPRLDYDIRALWLPEPGGDAAANAALTRPSAQLPLILITEVALAQMFMAWGVRPSVLVGHSMGENAAACLAGVMRFEDCIGLVHLRGQLFDTLPGGGMLAVPLSVKGLEPYLADDLDIASVNAPELTVVSGPDAALARLQAALVADEISASRIAIDIAAHSRMLEPILGRFRDYLAGLELSAPQIPIISNRTGQEVTAAEAMDPDYWVAHLRGTVQFSACMQTLSARAERIYIEMGPGRALSSFARMQKGVRADQVLGALRHPDEAIADDRYHLEALGRIWAMGGQFDWAQIWGDARRVRVELPGYAFQRSRYFIEPGQSAAQRRPDLERLDDLRDWGTELDWKPAYADCEIDVAQDLTTLRETWLIFADQTGRAAPVIAALRAAGQRVIELRAGDTFLRQSPDLFTLAPEHGREAYVRLLSELIADGIAPTRIAHFWLVTEAADYRPGSNFLHRNLEQGFYALVFLAQAMQSEGLPLPVHMTIVTNGAQAARGEALAQPEKAMIAGPARVAPREVAGLTCATLDVDDSAGAEVLLEELCAIPANTVALYRKGRRYARVLRSVPLEAGLPDLPKGAHWVITGGFGGMGLAFAEALIRETAAKITLIARGGLGVEREEAVARLQALGGHVHVARADVSNIDQMREALEGAQAAFGAPYGLIHAAGVIDDAPILAKSTGDIEEVLAPKLHGLQVIDQLLPDGALGVMVLCASTSTLSAPVGQVDYVAANEYLNAFALSRRGATTRVIALDWGIWSGAGMAARAMAERLGETLSAQPTPCAQPLLAEMGSDTKGQRRFTKTLRADDWVMDEHRLRDGTALLPGTAILEIVAESLHAQGEYEPFEISDLFFFRPVMGDAAGEVRLQVTLARTPMGYDVTVASLRHVAGRDGALVHASAQVRIGAAARPAVLDLTAIAARCSDVQTGEGLAVAQEAHLRFGPRWRVLMRAARGAGEGLAHLRLPEAFREELAQGFVVHPALMDIATGWALDLVPGYAPNALWVPVSYDRITLWQALPAGVVSHMRLRAGQKPGFVCFDITLCAPDGTVLAEIAGFTMKELASGEELRPVREADLVFEARGPAAPLSAQEERLHEMLRLGITPEEGAEAFLRALGQDASALVISSVAPQALMAQADAAQSNARTLGQRFERPSMATDMVAPRNDVERTLAGLWSEHLGIETVGVEDNFFDLGGHSLIAVRLFAQIKKRFGVEFPISVLFEAPTIAAVAAMISARTEPQDISGPVQALRHQPRFTHLVPMHEGEGLAQVPFFLVAGMFGNVLNLRHLATLLGRDRPFYGLQARGLFGGAAPHESITEAARDYIAEMRQVQPVGPYLLGGFSGGGIIAYEIAQQLEAAGEEVAQLVFLDTPLPVRPSLSRLDRALIKLAELRRKGPGYLRDWWRARRAWQRAQAAPARGDTAGAFHNTAIEMAFRSAVAAYEVKPWAGPLVLFRPPLDRHWQVSGGAWVSAQREYVSHDNDWQRHAPHLQVIEVPGDHDSMVLEPNVRVLAARLQSLLPQAPLPHMPPAQEAAE